MTMTSKRFIFFIFICLVSLSGCAPSVRVKILKPALLDMEPFGRIAVTFTEFRGHWDLADHTSWPRSLEEFGIKVLTSIAGLANDRLVLDPLETYSGRTVSADLIAKLVDNGYYIVVESDGLADLIEAEALSYAEVIDKGRAADWGHGSGVDAVIVASGTYSVTDEGDWEPVTLTLDKKGKNQTQEDEQYRISRKVDVRITYRVVKVSNGQVVNGSTISASNSPGDDSAVGEDERAAQNDLPDWYPIMVKLVDQLLDRMVRQIAPYYIEEKRKIERGKGARMKAALEYAKQGMWEEAKPLWEAVIQDSSSKSKTRLSATYNLGLYYELQETLTQAESLYDECYRTSGKSKYLEAVERVKKRKRELERLK